MNGTPDINRMKHFAEIAHFGQTYNDEVPYTYHLEQVQAVLVRFGVRETVLLVAGTGHDLLEDTRKSYNDIKERFGFEVAELIYAVTNEVGRNRKERAAKTYPKIAGNNNATILKLADRIANLEYGLASGSKQVEMYRREYPEFRKALYKDFGIPDHPLVGNDILILSNMWIHLDTLMKYDSTPRQAGPNEAGIHRISDLQKNR
jgi:(p)ppGpp synthase/HD superfamily hydrolase